MPLLTASEVRQHVETDLDETGLQRIIDRADADLLQRAGPHVGPITETLPGGGGSAFVARPIATLTSVREGERISGATPALDLTLDVRLWAGEGRLERRPAGTRFDQIVEVVYDPIDDSERRKRTLLELVRLDLSQSGRGKERVGEYSYAGLDYRRHREALMSEVRPFLTLE